MGNTLKFSGYEIIIPSFHKRRLNSVQKIGLLSFFKKFAHWKTNHFRPCALIKNNSPVLRKLFSSAYFTRLNKLDPVLLKNFSLTQIFPTRLIVRILYRPENKRKFSTVICSSQPSPYVGNKIHAVSVNRIFFRVFLKLLKYR